MTEPLLTLDAVSQVFGTRRGEVRAVDDVSLDLRPGQVVCLVGESGSGKTTAAKMAAGLRRPTSGEVRYGGQDIWRMRKDQLGAYRRAVQRIVRSAHGQRFLCGLYTAPPRFASLPAAWGITLNAERGS